ncbi:4168_t:CDS:2 [Diversispora eburnea]|uniref:4168_t:CDS:1 n=1 Tax=Diversispora eburnea TaxID=1213867 RepID=A0A9N8YJV3_9GLOM|nr:4168_t:CDS:2 [Diversispora eburnea]
MVYGCKWFDDRKEFNGRKGCKGGAKEMSRKKGVARTMQRLIKLL